MTEIEIFIKKIMEFHNKLPFSMDIYFDDLRGEFVCKVHRFIVPEQITFKDSKAVDKDARNRRFRNKYLVDSLIEAHQYLNNIDVNNFNFEYE